MWVGSCTSFGCLQHTWKGCSAINPLGEPTTVGQGLASGRTREACELVATWKKGGEKTVLLVERRVGPALVVGAPPRKFHEKSLRLLVSAVTFCKKRRGSFGRTAGRGKTGARRDRTERDGEGTEGNKKQKKKNDNCKQKSNFEAGLGTGAYPRQAARGTPGRERPAYPRYASKFQTLQKHLFSRSGHHFLNRAF